MMNVKNRIKICASDIRALDERRLIYPTDLNIQQFYIFCNGKIKFCYELKTLFSSHVDDVTTPRTCFYPIKLTTTRWRITWANIKSANARCGAIDLKSFAFSGFTCNLKFTPRTNDDTHEMNPARNELKGKVPARSTYTNWMIPGVRCR